MLAQGFGSIACEHQLNAECTLCGDEAEFSITDGAKSAQKSLAMGIRRETQLFMLGNSNIGGVKCQEREYVGSYEEFIDRVHAPELYQKSQHS
jgi:hypothetical protein